MGEIELPDWWTYPRECRNGHRWGPGRVIIAFTPCPCAGGKGHERLNCGTRGCRETWYRPKHDPSVAAVAYPKP